MVVGCVIAEVVLLLVMLLELVLVEGVVLPVELSSKPKERIVRAIEKSLSPCNSCSVAGEGGVGVAEFDQKRLDDVSKDKEGGGKFNDPERCLPPPTGVANGGLCGCWCCC